jgi:glutamyl-tRNA reductase
MAARPGRPLFLIDIAVPRDIAAEVQELPNVYLYNVDHLETMVRENVRLREQELAHCTQIIEERTVELLARLSPAPTAPAGSLKETQPAWALGRLATCQG